MIMKTFYSALLLTALFMCLITKAIASPAYPGLIKKIQPDGTMISLYLKGDEKVHWMESEDGYSLLYDSNRNIVYATSDEEGNMIASSVAARDVSLRSASDQAFLKNVSKKLTYSQNQVSTLRDIWKMTRSSLPLTANSSQMRAATTTRGICALISFPDKPITKTVAQFNNLMNQVGYSAGGDQGSVHDYYLENSYGKIDFEITVAGPYTLSKPWSYYGANDPSTKQDSITRVHEFATEAANLTFKDPSINPATYDNNNDGYIDGFHIIYAGYGEEAGAPASAIWAHESGIATLKFGNEKLDTYSCSPELSGSSGSNITHIGVVCHEMGHALGAPDFYDTSSTGSYTGTGNWDLMAGGSWNNSGACPAHINMYEKIQLGWVAPVVLNSAKAITGMLNSAQNAKAYRYDTSTSGEYYILENRQKTGFDSYIPGTGLLIYHVSLNNANITNNNVNAGYPQKMYPVCASATTNPNSTGQAASYGKINSAGCPFPGTSGNTSFTDNTIPSAISLNGASTFKPVTEIQEQNGVISFNFMMPNATPVTNLQISSPSPTAVKLTWTKPADNSVIGYNIYRNDVLLINLTQKDSTSYTQYNVSAGTYNYCVTALYNGKESSPVCQQVQVTDPTIGGSNYPAVQNLVAQNVNGNKDIQLNWQSPFVSDWMTIAGNLAQWVAYDTTTFISAVRFTTDNLQKFQGSTLTKVRFSLYNPKCAHTVQVWLVNPGNNPSGNPIVSQTVSSATRNDNMIVTLNTPVVLPANKELWIGIKYSLSPMSAVAATDNGTMLPDQNFIYIDKWYGVASSDNFNWYIAGYMDFGNSSLKAPANDWLRAATATATNYIIYRDNVKIATTTQPTYVDTNPPLGSHIYCVSIAYSDGKESESVCVQATSSNNTAITPVKTEEEINIYPNPVKQGENLTIDCDANTVSTLSLYSISGQLLKQEQITGPEVQKRMDFEPGIYVLQIKNNSHIFTRRIIIK
jgi:M6 family metalloprotease-like protein